MILDIKDWHEEILEKMLEKIESGDDDQDIRREFFRRVDTITTYDMALAEDYLRRYMEVYNYGLKKPTQSIN